MKPFSLLASCAIAALAACWPAAAHAADRNGCEEDNRFGWGASFVLENDLFNHGDDRGYTNGAQLTIATRQTPLAHWLEAPLRNFPYAHATCFRGEIGLSQAMFTPKDISLVTPDPADRPYAGLALLSIGIVSDTPIRFPNRAEDDLRVFNQLVYYAGVVGPHSGADRTQRSVHNWLGAQRPEGWESQIGDRVVAGMALRSTLNLFPDRPFNILPHAALSVGSVVTDAELGVTLRVGHHMPRDFGLPRIAPSLPGSSYFSSEYPWGAYAFAGVAERFVAYDVTLDERPASGTNQVGHSDWVMDGQAGVVAYVGCLRASYTHIFRTRQFHGQDDASGFGAVVIAYSVPRAAARRDHALGWLTCMAR